MTNLEFLRTASPENVAKFLVATEDDFPDDWDAEMEECMHWLRDKFDEEEFSRIHYN